MFHDPEEPCRIFFKKMACGLENDMRNLAKFYQSTQKSQNWDFDGTLYSN